MIDWAIHFLPTPFFVLSGVRTFCPKPVSATLCNVGGCGVLLGLIAMANDFGGLYAAVKALVCVTKNNSPMIDEMQRRHGYQVGIPVILISEKLIYTVLTAKPLFSPSPFICLRINLVAVFSISHSYRFYYYLSQIQDVNVS